MSEHVLQYDRVIAPQEHYWDCGPASTQIVLNSRGIIESEDSLIRDIGTTTNGTDDVSWVERSMDRHGFDYSSAYIPAATVEAREALWQHIVSSINASFGCVINIDVPPSNYPRGVKGSASPAYGGGEIFHYIAAMGYDDAEPRAVWIADPGFRPFGYWVSLDQLVTMIVPKGYCYSNAVVASNDSVEAVMASNQEKFDKLVYEDTEASSPSRSFMATDGKPVDTPRGVDWNTDANVWNLVVTKAYELGVPWAVGVVESIAKNGVYKGTFAEQSPFLKGFGQAYCQALVRKGHN